METILNIIFSAIGIILGVMLVLGAFAWAYDCIRPQKVTDKEIASILRDMADECDPEANQK